MSDEPNNDTRKPATEVGICYADSETFWWGVDKESQRVCPVCSLEDEDYEDNHRFYALVAERDRYRVGLEKIAKMGASFDAKGTRSRQVCDIARAALVGDEATPERYDDDHPFPTVTVEELEVRQNELYLAMGAVESMPASEAQTECIVKLAARMRKLVTLRGKSEVGRALVGDEA